MGIHREVAEKLKILVVSSIKLMTHGIFIF